MRILFDTNFADGYLDYWCEPNEFRIKVHYQAPLKLIEDLYFIRPHKLRILTNYFFEVGLRQVVRKTTSRLKETNRNKKYIGFGLGTIIEGENDTYKRGQLVFALQTKDHRR